MSFIVETSFGDVETHLAAVKFYVKDGNLFLQSPGNEVAVYAAGQWRKAKEGKGPNWEIDAA